MSPRKKSDETPDPDVINQLNAQADKVEEYEPELEEEPEPEPVKDETPAPPTPAGVDKMDQLYAMMSKLVELQMLQIQAGQGQNNKHQDAMEKMAEAIAAISNSNIEAVKMNIAAQKAIHRPSNEVIPKRSVFNPRGEGLPDYTKPTLLCPMMIPETADQDCMTREEVELCNLLTRVPGNYIVNRIDDTRIKLTVRVERAMDEVTPSKLIITHDTAFNNEYFRLMPSKHSMLRQMFAQVPDSAAHGHGAEVRQLAREVLTMDAEQALIDAGKLTVAV